VPDNQAQSGNRVFDTIRIVRVVLVFVVSSIVATIWLVKWYFRGYSQRRFFKRYSMEHRKEEVHTLPQQDTEQNFTPQQHQMIEGLKRGSWFIILLILCVFFIWSLSYDFTHSEMVTLQVIGSLTSIATFAFIRMSIWVLKGFWKKD
jgi:hypothetical protein